MAIETFRYPLNLPAQERFDPNAEAVGKAFMPLLFDYERLHELVAADFYGHEGAGQPPLEGLSELVDYRRGLGDESGDPTLLEAKMLAVPASQAPEIPQGSGRKADFSTLTEFVFHLPPSAPQFPTRVRMWESTGIELRPTESAPNRHMVVSRIWRPIGAVGLLEGDKNQHTFVGDQIQHVLENGEPMPVTPIEEIYEQLFPGMHMPVVKARF
jgi:hypothetical protein